MQSNNPGKGLAMILQKLKFLRNQLSNWLFLPSCKKHGRAHLFTHGYDNRVECKKCWDEKHNDNWQ